MALKWPDKNPDMTEDFSVDWSRALRANETISAVRWIVEYNGTGNEVNSANPIQGLVPEYPTGLTNTDTIATIRFSSGIINRKYRVTCQITTSTDRTLQEDVFLRVTEGA